MANDKAPEMVQVPADEWKRLVARLEEAEQRSRVALEAVTNSRAKILDPDFEAFKAEAGRPASERTQDIADKRYGTKGRRFTCRLDSTTEDGKKGPNISEHFPLVISGNSDLEAQARYLEVMGIRKHDYRVIAEPVGAQAA